MELDLHLKQSQTLSAQQIQSMEILRMSAQELLSHIDRISLENPVLEVGSFDLSYTRARSGGVDPASIAVADVEGDTLYDHVIDQLDRLGLSTAVCGAAKQLAAFLDERGYITESGEELAARLSTPMPVIKSALKAVRSLDPAGVGASGPGHSIALQLERFDYDTSLAREVAMNYLDRLAKGQAGYIRKQLGCTEAELGEALRQIRATNPRPCAGFAPAGRVQAVVPDIVIGPDSEGKLTVQVGERCLPPLSVNDEYAGIYKGSKDKETRDYLSGKLREAKWLIGSVERRGATLKRIAAALAERQRGFFQGEEKAPAPLTMTELAEELDIHVSTVSRAAAGKYLSCGRGTFPLSYFFSRTLGSPGGASIRRVRELVAEIIDAEDKKRPLSDMSISKLMGDGGYEVSRRAVAKYRAELGIPPASARRRLAME